MNEIRIQLLEGFFALFIHALYICEELYLNKKAKCMLTNLWNYIELQNYSESLFEY